MNLTKLRGLTKINSNVIQNCCKTFSYKYEMAPAAVKEAEDPQAVSPVSEQEQANVRYTVCQSRSSPIDKPLAFGDLVRATAKANIEHQHLQPAMLPEFYQKQMERNVLINPQPDPSEGDRLAPANTRRFQVSKTYANAILPLKMVKLANPFPEPVKMMSSRTVSDQEKSEQMLVEARSQRQYNEQQRMMQLGAQQNRNFSTVVKRWYAKTVGKDNKKCKKFAGGKKSCPKLKVDHCPPPARTKCERIPKDIDCKKQLAPYPAYSEFCHEDLDERPSECKLCPWKPEENPNFKPKKKNYHTSASAQQRRGLEYGEGGRTSSFRDDRPEEVDEEEVLETDGMLCDMRKAPCKRPNNQRCPPSKKAKKKKPKKKSKKPAKKCQSTPLHYDFLAATANPNEILDPELVHEEGMSLKRDDWCDKPDTCKIKKFPFPKCPEVKKKGSHGLTCPKKKKKPLVKDCPPNTKCDGFLEGAVEEYQLAKKKKGSNCPQVDMTKIPTVTPCKPKIKENTKVCPGNLLKRRNKNKRKKPHKKASEEEAVDVIPPKPAQPNTEQPHQQG